MSILLDACIGKTSQKVWQWALSVNRKYTDNGTKRKKSERLKSGRRFLQPHAFPGAGSVPASSSWSRVPAPAGAPGSGRRAAGERRVSVSAPAPAPAPRRYPGRGRCCRPPVAARAPLRGEGPGQAEGRAVGGRPAAPHIAQPAGDDS